MVRPDGPLLKDHYRVSSVYAWHFALHVLPTMISELPYFPPSISSFTGKKSEAVWAFDQYFFIAQHVRFVGINACLGP